MNDANITEAVLRKSPSVGVGIRDSFKGLSRSNTMLTDEVNYPKKIQMRPFMHASILAFALYTGTRSVCFPENINDLEHDYIKN